VFPGRLVLLVHCVVAASSALAVAPPPATLNDRQLLQLIEQLGDQDFRVRDRAEEQLSQQGAVALPYLRKALSHRDPEIRRRALRLIPSLEHAVLVAPRCVTLRVRNRPLLEILEEISKQTGYKIQHQGGAIVRRVVVAGAAPVPVPVVPAGANASDTFSFDFANTPFWDAIEEICQASNLSVQNSYGDDIVRLSSYGQSPGFVGRSGAFRYWATSLQLYRNVDLSQRGTPSRAETLTLNVQLAAEPRLPFLGIGQPQLELAYDNERNSLLPNMTPEEQEMKFGRVSRYYGGSYKQLNMSFSVQLNRVSEKATSIKLLRGVIPVTVLTETRPAVIADKILSASKTKTVVGDIEFTIESTKALANNQYEIKFSATNKAVNNDYSWMNNLYQRLELQDAAGNKYQQWGSNWHGGGGNSVSMTLTYNGNNGPVKPGPPQRFVYQVWSSRTHPIHFEFRDIPLP